MTREIGTPTPPSLHRGPGSEGRGRRRRQLPSPQWVQQWRQSSGLFQPFVTDVSVRSRVRVLNPENLPNPRRLAGGGRLVRGRGRVTVTKQESWQRERGPQWVSQESTRKVSGVPEQSQHGVSEYPARRLYVLRGFRFYKTHDCTVGFLHEWLR